MTGAEDNHLTGWLASRLDHMENILKEREWLAADRFTVADLLMADVLRVAKVRAFGDRPATESYVTRITERSAFKKAHADLCSGGLTDKGQELLWALKNGVSSASGA